MCNLLCRLITFLLRLRVNMRRRSGKKESATPGLSARFFLESALFTSIRGGSSIPASTTPSGSFLKRSNGLSLRVHKEIRHGTPETGYLRVRLQLAEDRLSLGRLAAFCSGVSWTGWSRFLLWGILGGRHPP